MVVLTSRQSQGLSFPQLAIRAAYDSSLQTLRLFLSTRLPTVGSPCKCSLLDRVCGLLMSRFDNFCDFAVNEFDEVAIAIDEVFFDAGRSRLFDDAHVLWNCQPDET